MGRGSGGRGRGGGNFSVCGTPSRSEAVERVWVLRKTSVTVRERQDDLQKKKKKKKREGEEKKKRE